MKKCTDLNFGEGSLYVEGTLHFQVLDSIYLTILILFFDDGTVKTSNTHPNRQQIPQH